ncbi:MAG: T9SS type A sorting domain-containing protein [Bacteroidota bacterium]
MKILYSIFLCCFLATSVLFAQDLEIYVSSSAENAIKQYDQSGTFVRDYVPANSGGLGGPQDIIFLADNTTIVSGIQNTAIKQYETGSGDYIGNFTSGFNLNQPTRMEIRNNLLYVIQWANTNNKVVRFDLNGDFVDEFTSIGLAQSIGMAWDNAGNLYVSSFGQGNNGFVQKFDTSGNDMGVFIDSTILQGPTNIWFDDDQNLLVEDWSLGIVRKFSSTGQYIEDFITGMTNPEGIAFLPDDTILICDWGSDSVEQFDADGNSMGTFASGNGMADPNAVVIRDPNLTVPENDISKFLVTTTIGDQFNFNMSLSSQFSTIALYTIHGALVEQISPARTPIWDASHLSEGIYLMVADDKGFQISQKIIIKK